MSSTPPSPGLSRTGSTSAFGEDYFPPVERLTVFDIIENLALPQRLQSSFEVLTPHELGRRSQARFKTTGLIARDKVDEWRKRIPGTAPDELERYRRRMRDQVERLSRRWNDSKTITMREKVSFIGAVLNIFMSGYLLGAWPEWFHVWYTVQLVYYLPIRFYTYRKREFHYFLVDLCYFVNLLVVFSIWVFPNSRRLMISTFCLAFGNNAIAIAMWRNSLVFHSLEKVTTLFIHIMPCVTLHCLVHLYPRALLPARFPAIHALLSAPHSPSLSSMIGWASVPYFFWQLNYHLFITVRRKAKIAAGRPTSFTWLRRSFADTWIGRIVLALPEPLQEPAFMGIQYAYALLTMMPCPLWFRSRAASVAFLTAVFSWSIYNGATYYIDVFGRRFQKQLEALRKEVERQGPPGGTAPLPDNHGGVLKSGEEGKGETAESVTSDFADATGAAPGPESLEAANAMMVGEQGEQHEAESIKSLENLPLLGGGGSGARLVGEGGDGELRERK
ncbi:hypothetical protein P152DRAFT_390260 [Eremomyces bilateralis CBS 781.70]|uniref:Glycerophosphocholine acyltransferase 1 n=1 Tax=Eremomyces bilateralis CBS 781.70 TaxID=1392243 RepID=A0A6G1GCZ4_9PEZI|nr:uncharacterized protein P152DRAFT_390260 [Eremomyces bilateralis CBS 781.70]KAF1815776.1 hypothetical protein P152DRAFT_390260 [Eremomyces bilateralis CBS 781.70]